MFIFVVNLLLSHFDLTNFQLRFDYRIFFVRIEEFRNLIFTFFIFN